MDPHKHILKVRLNFSKYAKKSIATTTNLSLYLIWQDSLTVMLTWTNQSFFWLQISLSLLNKILQIDNQSATNQGFESVAIEMLILVIILLLI